MRAEQTENRSNVSVNIKHRTRESGKTGFHLLVFFSVTHPFPALFLSLQFILQELVTCRTRDGTEKIMASLKMGFVSSLLVDVFFLLIFLPSCRR